jgi:hypothetical protein
MHLAGGTIIFIVFVVAYFFVVANALYTRSGSGINQHPYRDPYGDAPGAWRPSSLSHDERASIHSAPGTR